MSTCSLCNTNTVVDINYAGAKGHCTSCGTFFLSDGSVLVDNEDGASLEEEIEVEYNPTSSAYAATEARNIRINPQSIASRTRTQGVASGLSREQQERLNSLLQRTLTSASSER